LWRHHLQIPPAPRVAEEDMVVAAAVMGAAVFMAVAAVSTAVAAFMAAEVSTVVAEAFTAEASMSEDFTAEDFTVGDFMVEDFTAALFMAADFMAAPHMRFAPLREQDAVTARVTFKPTLRSALPALALRMFLEVPSQAATPPQAERLRATPAR
jgi:hypothetical protein